MDEENAFLIAGFPKSGNTWLGYLCAFIMDARYIDLHAPERSVAADQWIIDLVSGGLGRKVLVTAIHKTHALPCDVHALDRYRYKVLIVRDPRDVAVSYFYYRWYNLPVFNKMPWITWVAELPLLHGLLWKMSMVNVARKWRRHAESWREAGVFCIRYEDLRSDVVRTLCDLFREMGISPPDDLVRNAVEIFSFINLSKGRAPGEEQKKAFFRKGVVGDHANCFDFIDKVIFSKVCGRLMGVYGYDL